MWYTPRQQDFTRTEDCDEEKQPGYVYLGLLEKFESLRAALDQEVGGILAELAAP